MIGLGLSLVGESSSASSLISARSGGSFLLDDYSGAAAAYSVRKLNSGYSGNCMRVRRASDDSEMDISFDGNGLVDTSSIASHCGSSDGFVVRWYGQDADGEGNGLNATQSTSSSQPKIYDGTSQAVLTENGLPALKWYAQGVHMDSTTNETISAQSTFMVFRMLTSSGTYARMLTHSVNGAHDYNAGHTIGRNAGGAGMITSYAGFGDVTASSFSSTNNSRASYIISGTTLTQEIQPLDEVSTNSSLTSTFSQDAITIRTIGGSSGFDQHRFVGSLQEIVIYNSDKTASKTDIDSNIDTYFSIT